MLSAKFAKINLKKIQLTYLRPILFSNVRKTTFSPVSEQLDLPKEEEKVLEYWNKIDAFKLQLDKTKHLKPYTFYDGPPFATGLPHYGHICAGTIKDVVTRYAAQTGHYVERKFGWDCHGLPIEYEIDKEYGLRTREDVLKLGVEEYNKRCRGIVMKYSSEWREIVNRLGRWIDFDNDYKTMDPTFMESVWWVFKQMWDKGLIYRGAKVMPYSIGCATVLSNFEASQNFKEVKDPSVYIAFPLVDDPKTKLIAWTTTPWTLPSNLALCVNPTFEYVKIRDKKADEIYILAKDRIGDLYKEAEDYEVLETFLGKSLEGKRYIPLFDYFADEYKDTGAFQILSGNHVTNDAGTGVVHTAPGFGDDDYKICIKHSIVKPDKMPLPVDANGYFLNSVGEFSGQYIKDPATEKAIIKKIKENGRLVAESQIKHSYPFCWRSEKPLIYRAITSWFVDVTAIKEQLLENNKKAYWVPTFAQEKRFHNWLEDAQDWCFSRNRFWGNPIPVWVSEDLEEQICIGSIEELERLSGVKNITDLHKEIIDKIEIPSQRGKGMLRRIDEVFDCWFESGSMPFAQVHYPFSTSHSEFEKRFPADFIGEGLDQTRGWFYTLNVISTAVKNINPYKNLIVNGLVLASDGKKMSKRLKNYPDPMKIVNSRGADALRLYLMNSPLVRAETLCFKEEGVFGIVKEVFNPWYNVYRFLVQNISRWEGNYGKNFVFDEKSILTGDKLDNIMDKWIIAANQHLIKSVREEMESYRLYTVVPKLLKFLESLTNGYVRLNRNRLKGDNGEEDQEIALKVLFDVLLKVTLLMAPFVPFITEMIYQNLTTKISDTSSYYEQSIHFLRIPEYNPNLLDDKIEGDIEVLMGILEDARILREKRKVSFKHPLGSLTVITDNEHLEQSLQPLLNYIQDEINVDKILFNREFSKFVGFQVAPNHKVLGQKLQKAYTEDFRKKLQALNEKDAAKFLKEGKLVVNGIELTSEHLSVKHILKREGLPDHFELGGESEFKILLDLRQDEDMKLRGVGREIVNRIQRLRKKSKLNLDDDVVIFIGFENGANLVQSAFDTQRVFMEKILKKPFHSMDKKPAYFRAIAGEEFEYENEKFTITICKNHIILKKDAIEKKHPGQYDDIERAVEELEFDKLKKTIQQEGKVLLSVGGKDFELHNGEDFSMSISAE